MEFRQVIESGTELRALMGDPLAPPVVEKMLARLDRHGEVFTGRPLV